jgi:Glycosyltransferase family 9 (heptosyltransferase)
LETIPDKVPYLSAAVDSVLTWSFLVRKDQGLNAGICWSGKAYPDPGRSCPVEALKPLGNIKGINWNSLQIGWNSALPFPMTDNTSRVDDFADTAALIAHLDMVVTIDTAVAHLAGAMGKKVLLMVPFAPDWRWMQWWDDSPWYPTMKIFRQALPGDWSRTIEDVTNELKAFLAVTKTAGR